MPGKYDWLYFDDKNTLFHRVTLQNSFSEVGIPKGKSILSCEVAYNSEDKIDKIPDKDLIDECANDLEKNNLITRDEIFHSHLIDAGNVYPGISIGYEEELNRVKNELDKISNLYMHGAPAEFEYSDLQVLTAKSIDLAEQLTKKAIVTNNFLKDKKVSPKKIIEIEGAKIGYDQRCYVISEIGLNHNGDIKLAEKLIDQSYSSGANAVKLQTYKKGRISAKVRTSRYYEDLVDTQESLSSMLDKISFNEQETKHLFEYARNKNMTIFSTPFDINSLELLESSGCNAYKISSMDIVNIPLIREVAKTKKPIIFSTGMSDLSDIQLAVDTILNENNPNMIILHCVSSYPCPASSANLKMIPKLQNVFDSIIGYSDHTTGIDISLAAICLGAKVIEKHFTIDRKLDGPDHNFSIVEDELSTLIASIRRVEDSLIDHGYGLLPSELNTAQNLRRSLFYSKNIKKGKRLSYQDIEIKSPGIGIHPKFLEMIINKKLLLNVEQDHPISWEDLLE